MTAHAAGHHNAGSITAMGFHDQPWATEARCIEIGGDIWFPDKEGTGEAGQNFSREAKAICHGCPVREQCLAWALATDQRFGIWGGVSPRERAKMPKPTLAATGTDGPAYDVVDQAIDLDEKPAPVHYGGTYVGGTGHRPVPLATDIGVRPAHTPRAPRPSGLDWSKHTAPAPETPAVAEQPVEWPCRWCRTPSAELIDDMCPDCRHEAERQFHAPDNTTLGRDLAELERTDPTVAAAAASYDDMVARVTHPEDHIKLPTEGKQGQPTTGSSAPGATSTSSTTGRAPVAGPSTPKVKNPGAAPETRPTVAPGTTSPVVEYVAHLLHETATSPDPLVQMLRGSALSVLAALDHAHHPTQTPAAAEPPRPAAGPTFQVFPRAETVKTVRRTTARRAPRSTVDIAKAKELLEQGRSCPQIAAELGCGVKAVRTALDAAGIPRPDGRATHSGGQPRTYDDQTIADVRRLYLDEHQSRSQVADQLGLPYKTVVTIMARHGIPARQRQAGNLDGARTLKQQIADLGVSSRDIKTWALAQGLITELKRGLPGLELVDAYAAAHPTTTKENA